MKRCDKQTWVEIHRIVLEKGERSDQLPEDTRQVPLEMKLKGFVTHDAVLGQEAEIVTPTGRRMSGTLTDINPAYTHRFGAPIPEIATIGTEVRNILKKKNMTQ